MVLQTSQLELNEQMAQHALSQSTVETMELAKTVMVQREEVALARRATRDAEMREEHARQFHTTKRTTRCLVRRSHGSAQQA